MRRNIGHVPQVVADGTGSTNVGTITVKRTRSGTIDSHFAYGGSASGVQQRTLQFTSTP